MPSLIAQRQPHAPQDLRRFVDAIGASPGVKHVLVIVPATRWWHPLAARSKPSAVIEKLSPQLRRDTRADE